MTNAIHEKKYAAELASIDARADKLEASAKEKYEQAKANYFAAIEQIDEAADNAEEQIEKRWAELQQWWQDNVGGESNDS